MAVTVRLYDDHRGSAFEEGGYPTIYLCEECAEDLGGDVTERDYVHEAVTCTSCGRPNQAAEEAEAREAEYDSHDEPYR